VQRGGGHATSFNRDVHAVTSLPIMATVLLYATSREAATAGYTRIEVAGLDGTQSEGTWP
jgi:hypothetical protein